MSKKINNKTNIKLETICLQFINVPLIIKSNNKEIISQIEDVYKHFKIDKIPDELTPLELTVFVKKADFSNIKNFDLYASSPSTFDAWKQAIKLWCPKVDYNKLLSKVEKIPNYISKDRQQDYQIYKFNLFDIAGWLQYVHFYLLLYVLHNLKQFYILHGGCLALGNKGIILTGRSGSGKSVLTYALAKAGFRFLTDETILIDPLTKKIYPFPITPSFNEDGINIFKEVKEAFKNKNFKYLKTKKCFLPLPLKDIENIHEPITLTHIIFPKYKNLLSPKIKKISKEKTIKKLLRDRIIKVSVPISKRKYTYRDIANMVTKDTECYKLISNQLEQTINLVKNIVEK